MSGLRRSVNAIVYTSSAATMAGLILILLGVRDIGRVIISYSLIGVLIGLVLTLLVPVRANRYAMNKAAYRSNIIIRTLIIIPLICMILGLILRINHYPGGQLMRLTGLVLMLVCFIVIIYMTNQRKKQPIFNIPIISVSPEELDRYVGIYYNEQLKMHITVAKNDMQTALVSQATGQDPHPLNPIEKDIFNYDRAGIVVEFKPEEHKFILIQHGGYFPFIKQ